MILVKRIKDEVMRALDNWAYRCRKVFLKTFDKCTHRHASLSTFLTSRYREMFTRLEIEEVDFADASSKSLSFWCGDSLITTKLSEAFEYGFVIRKIRSQDGRLDAYVGEFYDTVSVDTVDSELRSILEQAEIALLEGQVDFSISGYSKSYARARQTWAELDDRQNSRREE